MEEQSVEDGIGTLQNPKAWWGSPKKTNQNRVWMERKCKKVMRDEKKNQGKRERENFDQMALEGQVPTWHFKISKTIFP